MNYSFITIILLESLMNIASFIGIYITEDGNHLFVFVKSNVILAYHLDKEEKRTSATAPFSHLKPQ